MNLPDSFMFGTKEEVEKFQPARLFQTTIACGTKKEIDKILAGTTIPDNTYMWYEKEN